MWSETCRNGDHTGNVNTLSSLAWNTKHIPSPVAQLVQGIDSLSCDLSPLEFSNITCQRRRLQFPHLNPPPTKVVVLMRCCCSDALLLFWCVVVLMRCCCSDALLFWCVVVVLMRCCSDAVVSVLTSFPLYARWVGKALYKIKTSYMLLNVM